MRGHLIIGKHHSFYNINNNLIKVDVRGNNNKIINPHKIENLFINGNNNTIEVIRGGTIINIKAFGNNNKIFLKNFSPQPNYMNNGVGNELIRNNQPHQPLHMPMPYNNNHHNIIFNHPPPPSPIFNINLNTQNNNVNNILDKLEKLSYFNVSVPLKDNNPNCTICKKIFLVFDEVIIFSCKNHIFHYDCLANKIKNQIGTVKCPVCNQNCTSDNNNSNNNSNSNRPFITINNNSNNSLFYDIIRLRIDDEDDDFHVNPFYRDLDVVNLSHNSLDDDDEFYYGTRGLDKNILDNMEISKIKDVDKLDTDKKKCTICLENYINGEESIALPCIHIFHANCIKTWLKNKRTCPICKYEIKYENEGLNEYNIYDGEVENYNDDNDDDYY